MAAQKEYELEDFQRSVGASFPAEYASVADPELFEFDCWEIVDLMSGVQGVTMVRIGHCIV